jgi:3-keto-5-aminohexanoate cleavage enzyme
MYLINNMNKLIINFTPTGMIPTKEMTPYVPITPKEIIKDVLEIRKYGVSMVHLHARGKDGKPTWRKEIYKEIIDGIRKEDKDLILCVSTSGRNWSEFQKRSECLTLKGKSKPDMGSLTLSSLNFNTQASLNSPDMIKALAKKMLDNNIRPELEAFDVGMINYAKYLQAKKLIKPPFYFNLILGNIACAQATPLNLGLMVNDLPAESIWSVGGVGNSQLKMNIEGIINGGGIRVGLEDNIWLSPKREKLADNKTLVKRIYDISKTLHIDIATPKEVRKLLKL